MNTLVLAPLSRTDIARIWRETTGGTQMDQCAEEFARRIERAAVEATAAPEMLEALELLFGTHAMHSVCRHEDADVFGRVKGTWSAKAEEKARAALAKAKGAAA